MTLFFYIFFFVLGAVIGSFLNVVIFRLKIKQSIFKKPSHCPFCKKKLVWFELIPIISFLIQSGKCRKCKKKISWQYPLVELATGLLFVLIIFKFFTFGIIAVCFLFLVSCFLIILFVYDLKHYLVPDKIIYPAIVLTLGFRIWDLFGFWDLLFGALVGGGFFLIIVLISKGRWMGIGDVKIGVLMGLLLGLDYLLVALFLAFFIGAIISIILIILKKKTLKSQIPFAPFLISATFITLFWGEILINWYLNLVF